MKIGLIDIDSKIPNLALMKLSAWHKNQGHKVGLTTLLFAEHYDKIYVSKVFDFSEMPILPQRAVIGGPGYDFSVGLSGAVENIMPDYDLYGCKYAMGFTSRGCNRRCPWCIVPQAEGHFRPINGINKFWNGQEKIMLLDSSMNTNDDHFKKILNQLIKEKVKVDFNQGLDVRYLDDKQAHLLSKVKLWKQIHFAWDLRETEPFVRRGIATLIRHGLKNKVMFYVLIGFNSTQEDDLYRIDVLRGLGIDPFVMPYDKFDKYQRRFARWVNHKAIFKSVKWENYSG